MVTAGPAADISGAGVGFGAAALTGTGVAAVRLCGTFPSSATSSLADEGRCFGSLAMALASTASSSSGSVAFSAEALGTGWLTVAIATSTGVAPPNGIVPVIISKVMTPMA